MATLRTFIALELPEEVKERMGRLQGDLQRVARERNLPVERSLKWVAADGIHVTLKFLGAVDAERVGEMEAAIGEAGAERPALRLRLAGLGAFPNPRQPRVLWVGLAGDVAQAGELQRGVEASLARLGFTLEQRPFAPHLTLARVRELAGPLERRAVAELLAEGVPAPELEFVADQLSLMKSELRPSGARYEALYTVRLGR